MNKTSKTFYLDPLKMIEDISLKDRNMTKIIFSDWSIGMRRLAFSMYLHEKIGLSLHEARDVGFKITDGQVVEIEVDNYDLANDIVQKSIAFGVKASVEI